MKKTLLLLVVLLLMIPGTVFASDAEPAESEHVVPDGIHVVESESRFIDTVGLISDEQAAALTKRLDEVSNSFGFDTVIAVVDTLNGWGAREYAAEIYEAYDFGMDGQYSGIILLLAMEDRDWGLATTGRGIDIFTMTGQEYLQKSFLPYFAENNYFLGFMAFANGVNDVIVRHDSGQPISSKDIPVSDEERKSRIGMSFGLSLVIALLIAVIVTGVWRAQLKSVRPQNMAQNYIIPGSMIVTGQGERFLYRNITRTLRESDSNSGGGGGFSSSSGRSYSGSSGKF